jgi:hypothetical protein
MVDGPIGKNGAHVLQNVTRALDIGCAVVADQNQKDLEISALENLYRPAFVMWNHAKVRLYNAYRYLPIYPCAQIQ